MKEKGYPSDCSDAEGEFAAPYLSLMTEQAPQREYPLREVFNALRYLVRSGCTWRFLPNDFPPFYVVYQQMKRWERAQVFEAMVQDLREFLRLAVERKPPPGAAILDARTLQSTPESGARAGYDGGKRRKGSKVHLAVDTIGHYLALLVTPANEDDRAQGAALCEQLQAAPGDSVKLAFVDQGYTGERAAEAAQEHGIRLEVVKLSEAKRGFVLLPRRWVVERTFGWPARFRRLTRDYERLASTLKEMPLVAFATLFLRKFVALLL